MESSLKQIRELGDLLKSRRQKVQLRQAYLNLLGRLVLICLILYLLLSQVFIICQAQGNDMFPAVKDGDLIIAFRWQKDLHKNDIILYQHEGKRQLSRLLGQGGDIVDIQEDGSVVLNGSRQGGEIVYPTYPKEGQVYPYRIPEDQLFVLGDFRTNTKDSRDFGPIQREQVEAKVISILRRRGL